jgi:glycosyltransferase involved in cell wall biosynthesis
MISAETGVRKFVGIIGSGAIGEEPFDRQSWSGSSYFFFRECERQGILHRAFGVELPLLKRRALMALNFSPNRRRWQTAYYMDPRYRKALTDLVRRRLRTTDFQHDFLQIGAMYDVPRLAAGRTRCFSYHDGNMAYSQRSPYAVKGLNPSAVRKGLAFERAVYSGLTRIFTMSEHLRKSFIDDFDVPPDRVKAIGAGINLEHLPDYVEGKDYSQPSILFIGVDFGRKGGWELLKAFKNVHDRVPASILHIVGPRSLSIPPELERGVRLHGFLRKTQPDQAAKLAELFRGCSMFVMPSLYEPFGIAPLEAMMHQLPCLVTNGWGLKETVIDGQNGGLVEPGNVDDLTDKILYFLSDPDRLRRMGERGRVHAMDYTWEKVVGRLKDQIAATGGAVHPS